MKVPAAKVAAGERKQAGESNWDFFGSLSLARAFRGKAVFSSFFHIYSDGLNKDTQIL